MSKPWKPTTKQQAFIDYYTSPECKSGNQAAIKAGYSKKGSRVRAAELLANSNVVKAIRAIQAKKAEKLVITREMILDGLREIAADKDASKGARVQAWNSIAKIQGEMSETRIVKHSGTIEHKHDLSDVAKAKLQEIYGPKEALPEPIELKKIA